MPGLTVKQLIRELKKYPGDAHVAWQDHDQAENEINGSVSQVREACDEVKERGIDVVLR